MGLRFAQTLRNDSRSQSLFFEFEFRMMRTFFNLSSMNRCLLALALLCFSPILPAAEPTPANDKLLQHSVQQLQNTVGKWDVVTEFLNEDGSVAKSAKGSYEFSWVVPDRVLMGKSEMPEMKRAAGILFYINEKKQQIEMVSVGNDGMLWTMTGPLGGETRLSQEFKTNDGGTGQLRFTRFNVSPDKFESKMEHTEDGGKTWKPGNHQTFQRATAAKK